MGKYIRFLYGKEDFDEGIKNRIAWSFDKEPHTLISGASGAGKSHCMQLLVGHTYRVYNGQAELILIDGKGDEAFLRFEKMKHCFCRDDTPEGWEYVMSHFEARRDGSESTLQPLFVVFDDFAGWLLALPKKEQDTAKAEMARILMQGRSFRFHLILGIQRPDMALFSTGSRDNIGTRILLGHASKDAQRMILDLDGTELEPTGRGEGYIQFADGRPPIAILVPPISHDRKLRMDIGRFLSVGT